jgi:hypothetical protein
VPEYLNGFLSERAAALVRENFTGVGANWWWERRIGGGIEVCQELDPEVMSREISERTGRDVAQVRRATPKRAWRQSCSPSAPRSPKDSPPGSTAGSRRRWAGSPLVSRNGAVHARVGVEAALQMEDPRG